VPSGASTTAIPGRGPGTPTWDESSAAWCEAVADLDARAATGAADLDGAVDAVLATDRAEDSLTLWHLIAWPALPEPSRARVLDRLAQLAPPPAGASRDACLALDAGALDAWRGALDWGG